MSAVETGGPAFPMARVTVLAEDGTPNEAASLTHDGMTLRDYFAAKAMQAVVTGSMADGSRLCGGEDVIFARVAYKFADAMLAARKPSPEVKA